MPISTGNHLALIDNKNLIPVPPQNSDRMIAIGHALTTSDQYGLVYSQTNSLWLIPWLGGFGGRLFEKDGKTPTLNTLEMVATLRFLHDLVYESGIVPQERTTMRLSRTDEGRRAHARRGTDESKRDAITIKNGGRPDRRQVTGTGRRGYAGNGGIVRDKAE